jgi:hypothetical protein
MPGRIRRGRPLPSQPLREHRGSRTRARNREKNAPLRRREKSFSSHFQSVFLGFEEIVEKFCQGVPHLRCNQTQSDAISMPGALCFRVFVFWAGRKGLCFVFLCFGLAQRACVLCFRVLADPRQTPLKTQQGAKFQESGASFVTSLHRAASSRQGTSMASPVLCFPVVA